MYVILNSKWKSENCWDKEIKKVSEKMIVREGSVSTDWLSIKICTSELCFLPPVSGSFVRISSTLSTQVNIIRQCWKCHLSSHIEHRVMHLLTSPITNKTRSIESPLPSLYYVRPYSSAPRPTVRPHVLSFPLLVVDLNPPSKKLAVCRYMLPIPSNTIQFHRVIPHHTGNTTNALLNIFLLFHDFQ